MPAPEEDSPPSQGRLIGDRYRLESKLGEGAMGIVWSGTDELLRRAVAVKEVHLPPGMPEEEAAEVRERALREARAIAVVTHPNVVTLYDVAREQGEPFVVMELVPSQSLAAILGEHGALSDTQIALITDGVAAALEAAHRNGIIHRDVKPGNVLIGDDGRIKLSDFGISRNIAEPTITRTGIMLGTPAFIAPEIASGEPVTASADLWEFGATLYAASEGYPPYDAGDDPLSTITAVVRGPVPAPARGGVLGGIISALMIKDPAQRMPPQEVRRRVQHLLPEPGSRPFEMLLDPDSPTVRVRRPAQVARTKDEAPVESDAPPLAADPGPLPFVPQEPPPRPRRRVLASIALGLAAVLLFAVALAGGFAGTRALAGHPVLPRFDPGPGERPSIPLVHRIDTAQHTSAEGTGRFQIGVPPNWAMFHDERNEITNSMLVYFVSPDGSSQITVRRFGDYYEDGYTGSDYLAEHRELVSMDADGFASERAKPAGSVDPISSETDQHLRYSISMKGVSPGTEALTRDTVERIMPRDGDLWVLQVTVPHTDKGRGEHLFDRIFGTFRPLAD